MPSRDFDSYPFLVIWETTVACGLGCLHCRASARRERDPQELGTAEALDLVAQVAELERPLFVLSGGDPMMREDLEEIVREAARRKLSVAVTASATPRVTRERIRALAEAGLTQWAFSLDGPTPEVHDRFRGVPGTFALTLERIAWLREMGLPVQVNTVVTRHNLELLPAMAELVRRLGAVRWEVFTLIPVGRAAEGVEQVTPEEHERVMAWLAELAGRVPFAVTSTEGPQVRRIRAQAAGAGRARGGAGEAGEAGGRRRGMPGSPLPVWDGNGFIFVSYRGEVFPSGFLPLAAGNVRERRLGAIYREAPLLRALRRPDGFHGKCGLCEYRRICGGSRALAYATTGDPLGSDPLCTYSPSAAEAL
ncbi:MAG: TIGR04053 family radical SAM/SPASM domain-containing protein [Bacillota bacterium]|nr:TIGR04053 family radical SAM/SPASM domain-containing protein [Bacillota bacterium]